MAACACPHLVFEVGRARDSLLPRLDIALNVVGADRLKPPAAFVAPGKELMASLQIGAVGVWIADIGGEKINEAPGCLVTGGGDRHRHQMATRQRDESRRD